MAVWTDARTAPPGQSDDAEYYDVYAQRITGSGTIAPGWPEHGVALCTAPDIQQGSQVVTDGAGGAIVAWSDYRNYSESNSDLYGQRVLANGVIAPGWSMDGMALSQDPAFELVPAAPASDGAGGAYVAYVIYGPTDRLHVVHVTSSGSLAPGWPANGIPVCEPNGSQRRPYATSDGKGGMIVAWEDYRNGVSGLYAQRVDHDFPTPVLATLIGAEAEPGRVLLNWFVPSDSPRLARVYRRSESSDWTLLGAPRNEGDGYLAFEDRSITAGRYAYRLGSPGALGEVFTPEEWVTVPAGHVLSLAGFHRNPCVGEPLVSFSLSGAQPARLELIDVSGRAIAVREVGSLGPGKHTVALGREGRTAPGIYWLRLTEGARSLVAKGVIAR